MSVVHFFQFVQSKSPIVEEFFGTAIAMRCFISQSVMDMIGVTDKKETAAGNTSHTIDAIDAFVQTSAMSQKRFKQKSNKSLTTQKNSWQKSFFQLLGSPSLFASRLKIVARDLKRREVTNGQRRMKNL